MGMSKKALQKKVLQEENNNLADQSTLETEQTSQVYETVENVTPDESVAMQTDDNIIKIGDNQKTAKSLNKFDIFWVKVWAAICAFINTISIYINKGIKFVFRKEAPLKYVKTVISFLLILLCVFIVSAPFKITVNEVEKLEIYPNGLTVVQKQVGSLDGTPIYKYGYADKNGKTKIDCKYDNAMRFKYGVAWVNSVEKDEKGYTKNYWYLINTKGKRVGNVEVLQTNDYVVPVGQFGNKHKLAPVLIGGKYCFVNTKGKIAIDGMFDDVGNFDFKIARIRMGAQTYFINKSGKRVGDIFYDARDFSEGRAAVSNNNLWGFIDENGNTIADLEYEQVSNFKQGYALVKRGATYGIIDSNGKSVVKTGMYTDLELVEFFEMNK